jgi:hypothetical protein
MILSKERDELNNIEKIRGCVGCSSSTEEVILAIAN